MLCRNSSSSSSEDIAKEVGDVGDHENLLTAEELVLSEPTPGRAGRQRIATLTACGATALMETRPQGRRPSRRRPCEWSQRASRPRRGSTPWPPHRSRRCSTAWQRHSTAGSAGTSCRAGRAADADRAPRTGCARRTSTTRGAGLSTGPTSTSTSATSPRARSTARSTTSSDPLMGSPRQPLRPQRPAPLHLRRADGRAPRAEPATGQPRAADARASSSRRRR